ncbi:hypothetical protein [Bythopirellula goksoeyrii]|uniref:PEP-CTERM protein-sorting domain-containing protein n=1 Tax=Bythopirellula goksoeyrii TaxID=1400387 RepID=A0A5B9QQK3_9BACT|nr:hypothetical protein [Bythopirellula goksoeyrii]QEG36401.1 hypothetical protein Pr1d_37150 [Bythopirellula goksoeyrii]
MDIPGYHKEASLLQSALDRRLQNYMAAGGAGALLASQVEAAVVSNTTPQAIGINQEVDIDFNMDGQVDFQIDHDRVDLNGTILDYLQIDKNDVSSAANPLPIDNFAPFPLNGTVQNGDSQYLAFTNSFDDLGGYAVGLRAGDMIGATGASSDSLVAGTVWDFQEGTGFLGGSTTIRANRLIDEDQGQIDINEGTAVTLPFGQQPEFPDLDDFTGNNGEERFVGVRVDLNDATSGFNTMPDQWWYGWIGIQIDNDADATGTVTGWAYETTPGVAIEAGDIGTPIGQPGDFDGDNDVDGADFLFWQRGNTTPPLDPAALTQWQSNYGTPLLANATAIPEPGSLLTAAVGGFCLLSGFAARRLFPGRCPKQ